MLLRFVITLIYIYSCLDHVTFGFVINDYTTSTVINRPRIAQVQQQTSSYQSHQQFQRQSVDNILFVPSLPVSITKKQSSCLYSSIGDIINNLPSSEDFNYFTQNVANQLASISMKDLGSGGPTNYIKSLPLMYGAGLLTSASPCVWGLLPLTMSYISQAAGEREDHETTIPTLAFAAGLATIFCTLGFMAVELGGIFGSSTSSENGSMILSTLSNGICLVMGFKLLDLINIRFPSFIGRDPLTLTKSFNNMINPDAASNNNNNESGGIINKNPKLESMIFLDATGRIMTYDEMQSRKENTNNINESNDNNEDMATATKINNKNNERGSLIRTFLLGGSSALVASPCATPVLTSILAYVASASNPFVGALLLLMYTAGYSTPLLIVAATGGQALENLRQKTSSNDDKNPYSRIGPWVTPITGGILLWYGTDGILHTLIGDPSLAGLNIYT